MKDASVRRAATGDGGTAPATAYPPCAYWSKRWEENGEATDFLRWLHTHPLHPPLG